jgi:hypothetical protein
LRRDLCSDIIELIQQTQKLWIKRQEVEMSNEMWRYLIAGLLIVHGLGHSGGPWMFVKSWLSPALTGSPLKWLFIAVWLVAGIGFAGAGIGVLQQQAWWRTLAVVVAVISLLVSALFIQGAPFNAAVFDVIVLAALLWLHWPPANVIGA